MNWFLCPSKHLAHQHMQIMLFAATQAQQKDQHKAQEKEHKSAAGSKIGEAWENIKEGAEHAKDAVSNKLHKNKAEGHEKVSM